jgi:hypothetical protein
VEDGLKIAGPRNETGSHLELRVRGTIKVVLTWNLAEEAFLKDDGSRERFRLLRGGAQFAQYIRGLQPRIETSSFFSPDHQSQEEAALAYRAGLLSQYLLDYEFLPTYVVNPDLEPSFVFDDDTASKLERIEFRPPGLREILERHAWSQLSRVWNEWTTKRVRLSRYGILQVVLEKRETGLVGATSFLEPLTRLHSLLGVRSLFTDCVGDPGQPSHNPSIEEELDKIEKQWDLAVPVQWEIVGRILAWLIDTINAPDSEEDLIHFDPSYRTQWRRAKAHGGGTSLPLRARFVTIHLDEVTDSESASNGKPPHLTTHLRKRLASLLEGMALVEYEERVTLSPQSNAMLAAVLRGDLATWQDECCLLSYDTALVTALNPPGLIMKLDLPIRYGQYWLLVARTFEYLNELRLLARFIEYRSSALFEKSMIELSDVKTVRHHGELARRGSALAGLLARLRAASAPHTVTKDGTLLSKVDRLRTLFNIGGSIEHAERNLIAIQRIVTHAESQTNDRGVLTFTLGLAAFTAALMGLALPPYYHYSLGDKRVPRVFAFLADAGRETIVEVWGTLALMMIIAALGSAMISFEKLYRIRKRLSVSFKRVVAKVLRPFLAIREAVREHSRTRARVEMVVPFSTTFEETIELSLVTCEDGQEPLAATCVAVSHCGDRLRVQFMCDGGFDLQVLPDDGSPVWQGEAVFVFLAPGLDRGSRYIEIEVGPTGRHSESVVLNPTGLRSCLALDKKWSGARPKARSTVRADEGGWGAVVEIPLAAIRHNLGMETDSALWMANFYRIRRPKEGRAEFSAWQPTMASPADFHRPSHFGYLSLMERKAADLTKSAGVAPPMPADSAGRGVHPSPRGA